MRSQLGYNAVQADAHGARHQIDVVAKRGRYASLPSFDMGIAARRSARSTSPSLGPWQRVMAARPGSRYLQRCSHSIVLDLVACRFQRNSYYDG